MRAVEGDLACLSSEFELELLLLLLLLELLLLFDFLFGALPVEILRLNERSLEPSASAILYKFLRLCYVDV